MELSAFIRSDMSGILQEWEDFARTLPGARSMNRKQLRDHAERILRTICDGMECEQSSAEEISRAQGQRDHTDCADDSAAQEHGAGRLDDGFSMPEMVAEYRALRASVVRRWRKQIDDPEHSLQQLTRFNEGIDQALTESIKRFSDNLGRARELFMGTLGHDLRGPLHVILSAARYLQKPTVCDPKHAEMLGHIVDSSEHIERLINELLDVAQTKLGGVLPINPAPADAAEISRRVIAEMRALHPRRQFDLKTSGDLKGVWDAGRLEQLIYNLVSNAAQHGDAAKVVTIAAEGRADALELSVHNQGEPIPKPMLDRIFEPLVRNEESGAVASGRRNMGLGLYIACTIVRAHQGLIDVSSSRASGTTFRVSLPKKNASNPESSSSRT